LFGYISQRDPNLSTNSASETAGEFKILTNIARSIASHAQKQSQQGLINVLNNSIEQFGYLYSAASEFLSNPNNPEVRRRMMGLADSIPQSFANLKFFSFSSKDHEILKD